MPRYGLLPVAGVPLIAPSHLHLYLHRAPHSTGKEAGILGCLLEAYKEMGSPTPHILECLLSRLQPDVVELGTFGMGGRRERHIQGLRTGAAGGDR